jgi:hypothetical protein
MNSKTPHERICKCKLPAVHKVVTQTENKGKHFWGCSKGITDGCKYFRWWNDFIDGSAEELMDNYSETSIPYGSQNSRTFVTSVKVVNSVNPST